MKNVLIGLMSLIGIGVVVLWVLGTLLPPPVYLALALLGGVIVLAYARSERKEVMEWLILNELMKMGAAGLSRDELKRRVQLEYRDVGRIFNIRISLYWIGIIGLLVTIALELLKILPEVSYVLGLSGIVILGIGALIGVFQPRVRAKG